MVPRGVERLQGFQAEFLQLSHPGCSGHTFVQICVTQLGIGECIRDLNRQDPEAFRMAWKTVKP